MAYQRTALFLTANLGSEVTRFVSAFENGHKDLLVGAYNRTVGIIDELQTFPEMKNREGEIVILRTVLEDMLNGMGQTKVTPRYLKEYFIPFALRLMSV
ncbi:MAG: hypothetical protein Q7S86_05110 [bacterium]|nr:hypothetical protein [bacterium]